MQPTQGDAVTDFCIDPQILKRIARQTGLMNRMRACLGIAPDGCDRGDDAGSLWCEARFKCIGCTWSRCCADFLAIPQPMGPVHPPGFCANAQFFENYTPRNSKSGNRAREVGHESSI